MKKILQIFIILVFAQQLHAQTQIAVCPQITSFSSMSRGYYFTAPCNFTICGLYVPTDMSTANQSVAVVRFTAGAPPAYSATTNSFVELFYSPNYPINAMIPCNVTVNAGDIIGVYGSRGAAVNSYGATDCPTTILGNPVTLYRSGMQFDLALTPMHDIWYENGNIGRVFMYINCCPTADFTATTPVCLGQTSTVNYTGSGTPPATSFSWSFPGGTPATATTAGPHNVTYSTAGTYTASLTVSQTGCTNATFTQNIVVNPNPSVSVTPASPQICPGGTATLTGNGASTYAWNTGAATGTINVSPASTTTYTVTGTSAAGCTGTSTVAVTVNTNPSVTVNSPTICNGQTATLTAGGTSTYNWSTGSTANPINVNPASTTTYTVTGTSAAGCTGTATSVVTVNSLPSVTVNSPSICNGQTATLTAGGASTYNWSTGSTANPINVSPVTTTTYTVTGTSALGCTNTATSVVTVNALPNVTVNSPAICNGQTATLTAVGASTYNWSTGSTANPINVNPASTTTYTVTGTSALGCNNTATSVVTVNALPNVTVNSPTICNGQTATLTAGGASTYNWSTGSTANPINVNPASTTTYTVTGTSAAGCTGTATSVVTVNSLPSVTVNSATICSGETATLTAAGATNYTWNTGASTNPLNVSPAVTTTYTVTGSSGASCTNTATTVVTVNPLPNAQITSSTDATCGLPNGSATASGGTSYNWSNGQTTATATGLSAQTYTCTVTSNGCDSVISVVIGAIPGYTISTSFTDEFCSASNGTATVTPNQAGTYSYSWSNGQSTNTITGLQAGNYLVTVTDAYGCTATASVTITDHPGPTLFITNVVNETCSMANGSMNATVTGGSAPITYLWSSGQNTASISDLTAGNYVVTVTDVYGCSVTASQTITNSPPPVVTLVSVQNCMCGATDGGITVSVAGGTAPLSYSWSNGQISQNLTNATGGTYTLIVTDASGCSDTLTATIDVIGGPQATVAPVNAYCGLNNGSATVNVSGGTGTYTYQWSNGMTTSFISGLGAGTYSVTVDDGNCTTTASCTISTTPPPVAGFTPSPAIADLDNAEISFFNNSTGATQYNWTFGDGGTSSVENPQHTYTQTGTFTVVLTVTNDQGCTDSVMSTILIKDPFVLWLPNAFTPDADGINDDFGPKGISIDPDNYQFYIFNRWGQQIFFTDDINYVWNGTFNGEVCKQDTYVWLIILKVNEHKFQKFQGHVTLIW